MTPGVGTTLFEDFLGLGVTLKPCFISTGRSGMGRPKDAPVGKAAGEPYGAWSVVGVRDDVATRGCWYGDSDDEGEKAEEEEAGEEVVVERGKMLPGRLTVGGANRPGDDSVERGSGVVSV